MSAITGKSETRSVWVWLLAIVLWGSLAHAADEQGRGSAPKYDRAYCLEKRGDAWCSRLEKKMDGGVDPVLTNLAALVLAVDTLEAALSNKVGMIELASLPSKNATIRHHMAEYERIKRYPKADLERAKRIFDTYMVYGFYKAGWQSHFGCFEVQSLSSNPDARFAMSLLQAEIDGIISGDGIVAAAIRGIDGVIASSDEVPTIPLPRAMKGSIACAPSPASRQKAESGAKTPPSYKACPKSVNHYRNASDTDCMMIALGREAREAKDTICPLSASEYARRYMEDVLTPDIVCFQKALQRQLGSGATTE